MAPQQSDYRTGAGISGALESRPGGPGSHLWGAGTVPIVAGARPLRADRGTCRLPDAAVYSPVFPRPIVNAPPSL